MSGTAELPIPRRPRYASLDMWRGVACLAVVVYHATLYSRILQPTAQDESSIAALLGWLASYGHLGVPMFFVISGYCISAAADSARRRHRPARSYFWRRFRRIYPPLWAAIGVAIALHALDYVASTEALSVGPWPQLRPWWYSGWQWFGSLTLTESWRHYIVGGPRGHFPGQAWTLCYEEQFYAVTGLLIAVAPRRLFTGAMVVTLGSVVLLVGARFSSASVAGWFFDGNWFTFAAGILTYFVLNYRTRRAAAIAGCSLLLAAPAALFALGLDAAAGFGFAALLLWIHPFDARLSTATILRPITWCGTMCYSLYLIHQPLVRGTASLLFAAGVTSLGDTLLITVPVALVVSAGAARLFYVTVERRFLNTPAAVRPVARFSERSAVASTV